jgi:hypothetical protein
VNDDDYESDAISQQSSEGLPYLVSSTNDSVMNMMKNIWLVRNLSENLLNCLNPRRTRNPGNVFSSYSRRTYRALDST